MLAILPLGLTPEGLFDPLLAPVDLAIFLYKKFFLAAPPDYFAYLVPLAAPSFFVLPTICYKLLYIFMLDYCAISLFY